LLSNCGTAGATSLSELSFAPLHHHHLSNLQLTTFSQDTRLIPVASICHPQPSFRISPHGVVETMASASNEYVYVSSIFQAMFHAAGCRLRHFLLPSCETVSFDSTAYDTLDHSLYAPCSDGQYIQCKAPTSVPR
jgi:hypothetical protein